MEIDIAKIRTPLKSKQISVNIRKRANELAAKLETSDDITNQMLAELADTSKYDVLCWIIVHL